MKRMKNARRTSFRTTPKSQPVYADQRKRPSDPAHGLAYDSLASGDWPELERLCHEELASRPGTPWALKWMAYSLNQRGLTAAADGAYQEAFKHIPNDPELNMNMGSWLLDMSRTEEALTHLEPLTRSHPLHSLCWGLLASAHYQLRNHRQGFNAAQMALKTAHTVTEKSFALQQLAIHRRELGEIKEAILNCEEGLRLCPDDLGHHTNRMLFLLADPDLTPERQLRAAQDYAASTEAPWKPRWPSFDTQDRSPNRRLKIGFLSPDFRNHSVMYFTEGLLALLDREHFEVHALHLHPAQDHITERVKTLVDDFKSLAHVSTEQAANLMRSWQLDIVVDLAGHTGHNGLAILAQRVAPVQVSTLGYPGTTGLTAIDYRISDHVTDPPDAQHFYTEQLWRLDSFFCVYRPCIRNPLFRYQPAYAVSPAPVLTHGHITFGSCTNLGRLTDTVLRTWARILERVPESRLLIEGKDLDDAEFAKRYQERCKKLGIPSENLTLIGLDARNQYLTYHKIDIVLDPFPLNSGTTSFDSVWMGVPFITLAGDSFRGRIGLGILQHLGLEACATFDEESYIEAAVSLAVNPNELDQLRQALRPHMEASALMDEAGYTRGLEIAFRTMWWKWASPDLDGAQLQYPAPGQKQLNVSQGERIDLNEAYRRLQYLTDQAKHAAPDQAHAQGIEHPAWIAVYELAETVMNTYTQDPVALACLAEIENAHGHTDFAVCYMNHAMQAMAIANTAAAPE